MGFERILGQEHVTRLFRGVLQQGRLAHAYLLLGPPGVGKATFAHELAKAVLCRHPRPDACDACNACEQFESGRHPDVYFVQRGKDKRELGIETIAGKRDHPPSGVIRDISIKPVEGGCKVFIVDEADRMSDEAANAFLKTLEEPPPKSLLLLVAASVEPLPATVVSRCQVVRFRALPAALIAQTLASRYGAAKEEAEALAHFAGGSLGRAAAMLEGQAEQMRDFIIQAAAGLSADTIFDVAEAVLDRTRHKGEPPERTRERLRPAFEFLLLYYRDLLMLRLPAPLVPLFHGERVRLTELPAAQWNPRRLEAAVGRVLEALAQIDLNLNVTLVVESLLMDLALGPELALARPA